MHYYPHNIGDFRKDTPHLSPSEKGIYRDLLDYAYVTEKPLPNDLNLLCRVTGAVTSKEKPLVSKLLSEFFVETQHGWEHKRVIAEIKKFYAKSKAGQAGAAGKWYGKTDGKQDGIGDADGLANGEATKTRVTKPTTNNQQPTTKGAASAIAAADGLNGSISAEADPTTIPTGHGSPAEKKEKSAVPLDDPRARAAIQRALGRDEKRGFSDMEAHYLEAFSAPHGYRVRLEDFDRVLGPFLMAEPRYDKPALAGWEKLPKESVLLKRARYASNVLKDLANHMDYARTWLEGSRKKEKPVAEALVCPCEDWVTFAENRLGWAPNAAVKWEDLAVRSQREFIAAFESENRPAIQRAGGSTKKAPGA